MTKNITVRIDDTSYELMKKVADGGRQTLSHCIEYATVLYSTEITVSNNEMDEVVHDPILVRELKQRLKEIMQGNYSMVD